MRDIANVFTKAFTLKGRASRLEFNFAFALVFLWLFVWIYLRAFLGPVMERLFWIIVIVVIPEIFFITAMATAMFRRIKDLNIDWENNVAGRLFLGWKCHLEEGDPGPNKYGPPPGWTEEDSIEELDMRNR